MWELFNEIPSQELWEMHRKRKRRMVAFVRERSVDAALARKASVGRSAAAFRSARSGRFHDRFCAAFRYL